MRHHRNSSGARGAAARRIAALTALIATIVYLDSPAGAQMPCVGDCDGNRVVAINELIRGVSIALTQQPASSCPAFDSDLSDTVTINELVQGVGAALRGCFPPVAFRGLCRIPSLSGLVPCAAGSAVRLSLCLDRTRCLFDPTARRLLSSGTLGAEGRYFLSVDDEDVLNALLLLESDVATGITYRALAFGPAAAGASISDFDVDPIREAIARLFNSNGLDLFSDLSISDIIAIIANALAALDFAGLSPEAAAQLAENSANQNPAVQEALNSRRFTPTPTRTATSTSTQALTATSTATPTIVLTATVTLTPTASLTPTVTLTPTATLTASQTASQTATFTASLSPSASPTLTPTASTTATPSSTPTPTITNSPTATLPPLNLVLEINPDPARPGETIEASLIVSNTGGSSLGPISLELVLPMAIDPFLDNLASGTGRCGPNQIQTCNPGATVTWPFIGNIAPGEAIAVRVPPIVAAGTANGTELTFTANAGAPGLTASETYTVVVQTGTGPAPYDLALTADREPVAPGTTLTYTATYGFRAVAGQADTVLRVRPPQGTTFVNASDGGDLLPSGEIEWPIGVLTPGDGGIRTVTVAVDGALPVGTILDAQGVIERADGSGDKRANAVTWAQAAQAIGLEIETNPDPAQPGDSIETSITVTNPGPTAQTVTLHLVAPDQVETIVDGTATGDAVCGPFTLGNPCERRSRILWTLTVPPRDGLTVRVDPLVSAGAINGSLINFQARLVNVQGSYVTAARSAVRIDAGTIWDLYLDDQRDPVGLGETFTYRLTLRHRPSDVDPADGVLTLRLPTDVTLVDAGGGIADDGTIEWDLGTLDSNAVVSRSAVVQVANGATPGSILAAQAEIHAADDALAAKRVQTLTRIAQSLPLGFSAMLHPDPVRPGEVLQTEVTASNSGSSNLSVRFELRIPTGTDAFAQTLSAGASCSAITLQCAPATVGRWHGGVLVPGDSASIQLPPRVSAATADGTLLRLHARVADLSQNAKDSVLSRTVIVDGDTPFDLSVNESDDPVIPGQMMDYTVHFGRRGPAAASDSQLRLELPPNVFFVSSPDGGVDVDNVVQWDLGMLADGDSGSRVATVVVDAVPPGTPLHARATIVEEGVAASAKRADVNTVAGTHPITFTASATPDPVTPGGAATVSFSITNNGATTLNNLVIEGFVPPESNGFLDTATTGMGLCGAFSANQCEPRARVLWPISTLTSGQTIVVTMPPPIRPDIEPGTVIRFLGRLQLVFGNTPALFATDAVTVIDVP